VFHKFHEEARTVVEAHAAAARDVDGGKIFLRDDIGIEVENEFARAACTCSSASCAPLAAALELYVPGVNMPHRRFAEKLPLRRIEASRVRRASRPARARAAPRSRSAPAPAAPADDVGHNHSVDAAGGCACGSIQIGVAIEPEKIHMLVVAPRAGEQADDLSAIAAQNQHQRAAFHREFRARPRSFRPATISVRLRARRCSSSSAKRRRAQVAVIHDLIAGALQLFGEPGRPQRRRSLLASGGKWPRRSRARRIKAIFFG